MEVKLVNDQGTLMKDGQALSDHSDFDFSDLVRAEEAVALLAPSGMRFEQAGALAVARRTTPEPAKNSDVALNLGFSLPPGCSTRVATATKVRLRELGELWRGLDDGGSVTLSFARCGASEVGDCTSARRSPAPQAGRPERSAVDSTTRPHARDGQA